MERGRRFQLAISKPVDSPVAYDVFAGDCRPTPARFLEEPIAGNPRLRFDPSEIASSLPGVDYVRLMVGAGDGWITWDSALGRGSGSPFRVANTVLGCLGHTEMMGSDSVRNTLLGLLHLADDSFPGPSPARLADRALDR